MMDFSFFVVFLHSNRQTFKKRNDEKDYCDINQSPQRLKQ